MQWPRDLIGPLRVIPGHVTAPKSSEKFITQRSTMGIKRSRDFILTLSDGDDVESLSTDELEDEEALIKKAKLDLNHDFEFHSYGPQGDVNGIDDDGWGFGGVTGMKEGRGVDLDGIIERRRVNLVYNPQVEDDKVVEEEEYAGEQFKSDADSDEFMGFDDDDVGMTCCCLANYQLKVGLGWVQMVRRKRTGMKNPKSMTFQAMQKMSLRTKLQSHLLNPILTTLLRIRTLKNRFLTPKKWPAKYPILPLVPKTQQSTLKPLTPCLSPVQLSKRSPQ
jgi:hypothetical protein